MFGNIPMTWAINPYKVEATLGHFKFEFLKNFHLGIDSELGCGQQSYNAFFVETFSRQVLGWLNFNQWVGSQLLLIDFQHLVDAQLSKEHLDCYKIQCLSKLKLVHLPCFLVLIDHRKKTVFLQLKLFNQICIREINLTEINQRIDLRKTVEVLQQSQRISMLLLVVPINDWVPLTGHCCFQTHLSFTACWYFLSYRSVW